MERRLKNLRTFLLMQLLHPEKATLVSAFIQLPVTLRNIHGHHCIEARRGCCIIVTAEVAIWQIPQTLLLEMDGDRGKDVKMKAHKGKRKSMTERVQGEQIDFFYKCPLILILAGSLILFCLLIQSQNPQWLLTVKGCLLLSQTLLSAFDCIIRHFGVQKHQNIELYVWVLYVTI